LISLCFSRTDSPGWLVAVLGGSRGVVRRLPTRGLLASRVGPSWLALERPRVLRHTYMTLTVLGYPRSRRSFGSHFPTRPLLRTVRTFSRGADRTVIGNPIPPIDLILSRCQNRGPGFHGNSYPSHLPKPWRSFLSNRPQAPPTH